MDISEVDSLPQEELVSLYDAVGWTAYTRTPENFGPMLSGAWLVAAALDEGRLVGLVRVVGDGATVALVQDLLVHPEHQQQGIGGRLLDLVAERTRHIRQTYVCTDAAEWNAHVVRLYRDKGFAPVEDLGCLVLARFR